jgi:transcriptional regulator with XRE-family HTH domain
VHRTVAQRLTDALRERARSENWLASQIGVHQTTLNRQIKKNTLPAETVAKAAEALGVEANWLFTGRTEEEGPEQAVHDSEAELVLREIHRTIRYIGGMEELTRNQRRLRQVDYLEGGIRLLKREGKDAAPFYELMGRVMVGEFVPGFTDELEDQMRTVEQVLEVLDSPASARKREQGGGA